MFENTISCSCILYRNSYLKDSDNWGSNHQRYVLYLTPVTMLATYKLPDITTSHRGRGESSTLNFSEKRSLALHRRSGQWGQWWWPGPGDWVCRGRPTVVQAASPAQAAEPFYNDFFCMLRLLQVWTRRWGQGWAIRGFCTNEIMTEKCRTSLDK